MNTKKWVCQVRPGNPRNGKRLQPEDFFRPEGCVHITFEEGIQVDLYSPGSKTIILKNNYFCVVATSEKPLKIAVCLPGNVDGRKLLFLSPTTPFEEELQLVKGAMPINTE